MDVLNISDVVINTLMYIHDDVLNIDITHYRDVYDYLHDSWVMNAILLAIQWFRQ